MAESEQFEKTPKKAGRYFRAFILFALLYGITFSLNSFFNWIFFCAAAYSFFMSYFTLPVQPRIFQGRPKQERFNYRAPGGSQQASIDTQASRGRKVIMIVIGVLFVMFLIPFTIGLIQGFQGDNSTSDDSSTTYEPEVSDVNLVGMGNDFFNQQQYDSADKYYDLALNEDPDNMEAVYGKGIVQYNKGHIEDANIYFLKAYEGGFRYAWLSWALADMNDKQGNRERAVGFYKESVNLDSTYTDSYRRLAELEPANSAKYLELAQKYATN